MNDSPLRASKNHLQEAIENETKRFEEYYLWLEEAMAPALFEEITEEQKLIIAHNLMGFEMQEHFSLINLKHLALSLCLESPDADLKILEKYANYGIRNYQSYTSKIPIIGTKNLLRIGIIRFTEGIEDLNGGAPLEEAQLKEIRLHVKKSNPNITEPEINDLLQSFNPRFLRALPIHRITLALDMFFRARTRDNCQYEVRYNEDWEESHIPSMQIVLAWRNCPKHHFLYRIARTIHRHDLVMQQVNATYIDPYTKHNVLVMVLGIHGSKGQAAWDAANIPDFLRELVRVKYFSSFDTIDESLVVKKVISGNMGNLFRSLVPLVHQFLLHLDPHYYTTDNIEESYCRNPLFTKGISELFSYRFDPDLVDKEKYKTSFETLVDDIHRLDTGNENRDILDRTVLLWTVQLIDNTLKTNFYRNNLTALSFRLDPSFLTGLPYNTEKLFPQMPYGIFFMKGMNFFGFHVRFKDLARGGLRTVIPQNLEQAKVERNQIFLECYNLALTQHYKNKEIPEGGSKGVLFLKPFDRVESEAAILRRELELTTMNEKQIEEKIALFQEEQRTEYLHASQRSYIESLLTLVNCEPDGKIRAKRVVDYWKKPEYLYVGPDENMSNEVIQWIANFSKRYGYKPGSCFISSKPIGGINHKEYGVTSLGINVYMTELLKYLGINPTTEPFRVKLSGGPDGDVAGNMLLNLYKYYPDTAKVVALTDVSGTIRDPIGLNLKVLADLFHEGKPIHFYPPELLSEGALLLNKTVKRSKTAYTQQTLCWKNVEGKLIEEWISGYEMNSLLKHNLHREPADIFITAGGRPKTLNEHNYQDFLTEEGLPSARGIVEGANLYLSPTCRTLLEEMGVYIIKDSSANKTGVICSSFEVLGGLVLGDERFIEHKETLVQEILERLTKCAEQEAHLLLKTQKETGRPLTEISTEVSRSMNNFKYQILDYLERITLPKDPAAPLIRCAIEYCLPLLKDHYKKQIIEEVPQMHLKAIIAAHIASQTIYRRGLTWSPSIVDVLPILLEEMLQP